MKRLKQKIKKINGLKISYWDNEVKNYQKSIVLLPPGADDGSVIKNYLSNFKGKIRVICPDYPGKGNSDLIDDNSFERIAEYMNDLLKSLKLKKNTLVGISFGSCVANEMLKKKKSSDKLIIIAGGEYFNLFQKIAIKILFLPPKFSERIRQFYRSCLVNKGSYSEDFPKKNLKSILEQWLNSVNYKIKFDSPNKIKTMIINLKDDQIVRKKSIKKLKKFYPNHTELFIEGEHKPNFSKNKEKIIPNLVEKIVEF